MPDPRRLDAASHAQDQESARNRARAATGNGQLTAIAALADIELRSMAITAASITRHRQQARAIDELASQMHRTIITLKGIKKLAQLHEEKP